MLGGAAASRMQISISKSETGRDYYKPRSSTLFLGGHEKTVTQAASVAAHEFGHYLEEADSGIREKVHAFLDYRVGDEATTDIGKECETMKGEMGRKDNFDKYFDKVSAYYVGKEYKRQKDGETYATEIISMGVQALYENPVEFMEKDPEYAQFVIGVLRGTG